MNCVKKTKVFYLKENLVKMIFKQLFFKLEPH